MIASLKGKLESLGTGFAIIDVGGVGFQVFMPTSTQSQLGSSGEEVKLHTHLHLREDNATLFGFASSEEQGLFQSLINVSGLGPKLALAMLSAMNVEQLTTAIASGNTDLLNQIPGIGKKMANRLVVELKDKLAVGWAATPVSQVAQENTDVLAALTSLGYSVSEATQAVTSLPTSAAELSLEEKIKLALGYFGGK